MNLKPQPRPQRRATRPRRAPVRARRGRPGERQARRPGVPVRRRLAGRLPSIRRAVSFLGAVAATGGLVALIGSSWFGVTEVTWAGQHFTIERDLERILDRQAGRNALAVEARALEAQLEALPAIASASVTVKLPGQVSVDLQEHAAAFVWETASARLVGSEDGTLYARLPADAPLAADLERLPRVIDLRDKARRMTPGDRIPEPLLVTALRLTQLDPAILGSAATQLAVHVDDEFGLGLSAPTTGWELALGAYAMDPTETAADATARLDRQVTAVRTLFATQAEAGIAWVDARNPGKVYFRAKG